MKNSAVSCLHWYGVRVEILAKLYLGSITRLLRINLGVFKYYIGAEEFDHRFQLQIVAHKVKIGFRDFYW